jgi:hypothetical protein
MLDWILTSGYATRTSVIFTSCVWFWHSTCDFHTHACDFHTYAWDFHTHACNFHTHACDFDTYLLTYLCGTTTNIWLKPVPCFLLPLGLALNRAFVVDLRVFWSCDQRSAICLSSWHLGHSNLAVKLFIELVVVPSPVSLIRYVFITIYTSGLQPLKKLSPACVSI